MPEAKKSARRAVLATMFAVMVLFPSAALAAKDPPLVPLTPEALSDEPALIFHCGNEFVTAGTSTAVWSFRKADVTGLSYDATIRSRSFLVNTTGFLSSYDLPLAMLSALVDCLD